MVKTNIQVREDTADWLHSRKRRGESYDDVLRRELELDDDDDEQPADQKHDEETE